MAVLSLSDFGSPQAATRDARVAQRRQLRRGAFKKREVFELFVEWGMGNRGLGFGV
jgi:hypothetical protein